MSARLTPARIGADFVAKVLSFLGANPRLEGTDAADGTVTLRFEGEVPAILKDRDLLAAILQLASQTVSQATESRARVVVDFGAPGEKDAREQFLGEMAAQVADLVVKTGKRAVIEGLGSPERRLVHTALMDHGSVKTHSEGGESNRYLLVEPTA